MNFKYNDGGRSAAGFKGTTGDCVARAIAIALERPYSEVYEGLNNCRDDMRQTKRVRGSSARTGVSKRVVNEYLDQRGWIWTPTMKIGQGCKVHLRADELPKGRVIASVSKHLVAVIDGVINDTYDCSRDGTRCVYGYWTAA